MNQKTAKSSKLPLKKSKNPARRPVENSRQKSTKKADFAEKRKAPESPDLEEVSKAGKSTKILAGLGIVGLVGGVGMLAAGFSLPEKVGFKANFPKIPSVETASSDIYYSKLTGEKLGSAAEVTAPAYCIQTPNGLDGARPQAGLNEAGVVFEAIAEAGITRFAAVYQNPVSAIIGPIRSLRTYYLEWDTPFDCAIVHAGGSGDALAAVSRGYKDLTEDYAYMYRGTYGGRAWNNLFTTSAYLAKMNTERGYGGSDVKGFARMTPTESEVARINSLVEEKLVIYQASTGKTSNLSAKVADIAVNFGGYAAYNVRYNYDPASNTYLRSYATGAAHDVYDCPAGDLGEKNPEDNCTLKQLAPSVVVAMVVSEKRASDNYHEDITTVGSGDVYIFQNGSAVKGTWRKASVAEQIKFYDAAGAEVALAPGQTFVEAVPGYGSIEY